MKNLSQGARPNRRQVLRGAGGFTLALPLLPSLLPRGANAAASGPPRLLMFARSHGGYADNFSGKPELSEGLANKTTLFPGHEIAWGPIPRSSANGRTVVTRVVQGDSSVLTDRLLSKMNILRGFDNPNHQLNHSHAGFGALGPHGDAALRSPEREVPISVPSVDQIVAWSPTYQPPGSFRIRSLQVGNPAAHEWSRYWQTPATKSGQIVAVLTGSPDPAKTFDTIFAGSTPPPSGPSAPTGPTRRPVVDLVLEHYRMVRQSNRRFSAEDRRRLDTHMEMVSELQRRTSSVGRAATAGAACSKPARPAMAFTSLPPADYVKLWQTYADLIVAAVMCGAANVVTAATPQMSIEGFYSSSDWHRLCHGGLDNAAQAEAVGKSHQIFFEKVVLEVARKLDVEEAGGKTYLDNSLITYTNDQGSSTHAHFDFVPITLGSAGGFFKTGQFVDYRNRTKKVGANTTFGPWSPGLWIHQFWANVLDSMRVPRSEWASCASGGAGYGPHKFFATSGGGNTLTPQHYAGDMLAHTGDKLAVVS